MPRLPKTVRKTPDLLEMEISPDKISVSGEPQSHVMLDFTFGIHGIHG
jgi:hypothetical protein